MFDPFASKSSVVKTAENLAKPSRGHAERKHHELAYFLLHGIDSFTSRVEKTRSLLCLSFQISSRLLKSLSVPVTKRLREMAPKCGSQTVFNNLS